MRIQGCYGDTRPLDAKISLQGLRRNPDRFVDLFLAEQTRDIA